MEERRSRARLRLPVECFGAIKKEEQASDEKRRNIDWLNFRSVYISVTVGLEKAFEIFIAL